MSFSKFLTLALLAAPVLGSFNSTNSTASLSTQETCSTEYGASRPISLFTTTYASTTTLFETQTITSTPLVSSTVPASTVISTYSATSISIDSFTQVTDTYSSTSTIFDQISITSPVVQTAIVTFTATITQSPSTVTVGEATGFTPIAVANPGAAKVKREEDEGCGYTVVYITVTAGEEGASSSSSSPFKSIPTFVGSGKAPVLSPVSKTSPLGKAISVFSGSTVLANTAPNVLATPVPALSAYTTSTVFKTSVYTITSCAATVTDCPARIGSVTTEIISLYTTVCPVAATETPASATLSSIRSGVSGVSSKPAFTPSSRLSSAYRNATSSSATSHYRPSGSYTRSSSVFSTSSPTQYPSRVVCSDLVEVTSTLTSTHTAPAVTDFITPAVSTATFVSNVTITSTFVPVDASITLTIFSTSSIYTIIPSTTITTQTVTATLTQFIGATPTAYAACAPNNIITTYNGASIDQGDFRYGVLSSFTAASAYDCCVACQTAAGGCGGSLYLDGSCNLSTDTGVCDGSLVAAYFMAGTGDFPGISLSNGPCGQQKYEAE